MELKKKIWIAKTTLRKKSKAIGIILPGFKLYFKPIVIKIVSYWHKNMPTYQWSRIQSLEINPPIYGQYLYDKGPKSIIYWGMHSLLNKWCWENWQILTRLIAMIIRNIYKHESSRPTPEVNVLCQFLVGGHKQIMLEFSIRILGDQT